MVLSPDTASPIESKRQAMRKSRRRTIVRHTILILWGFLIMFPIYWMVQTSFKDSFGGSFTLGALISFLVTIVDQSIFNIGAPFWGLVCGFFTSWLLEREDFKKM